MGRRDPHRAEAAHRSNEVTHPLRPRPPEAAAAALLAAACLAPSAARALACKDLPSPIYGTGGSAHKTFFSKYGAALSKLSEPVTVVYQAPGACVAMSALGEKTKGAGLLTGTASYWDATGKEQTCDLPLTGQPVEFGAMGVFPTSCPGVTQLPAGVGDFQGAVNSWNLLVPVASSQQSISAEAVYFVFGFGKAGKVEPWTDEAQYFIRNPTSAATLAIAAATGLPAAKLIGKDVKTNQGTVQALSASTNPEAAIGYTSGEVADANRATVRTLAYQHTDQTCGYWPDSSAVSFDKRGVRQGLYYLWSPTHLYTYVDGQGQPTHPGVAKFVGWFNGSLPAPQGLNVLDLQISAGNIPKCAMHVWRDGDLAPLYSYQPPEPCGCYFEAKATGTSTCASCKSDADCGKDNPVCRYGFCEVK